MLRSGAKVTLQVAAAKGGQVLPSVASATSGQSVQGTPSRSRGICLAGTRMDPGENLVSQLRLPTALGPGQPVATQSRNEHPQPPLQSFPQRHPHLPGPTRRCPRPEAAVAPPPPSDVRSSASANRTALHESGRSPSKGDVRAPRLLLRLPSGQRFPTCARCAPNALQFNHCPGQLEATDPAASQRQEAQIMHSRLNLGDLMP